MTFIRIVAGYPPLHLCVCQSEAGVDPGSCVGGFRRASSAGSVVRELGGTELCPGCAVLCARCAGVPLCYVVGFEVGDVTDEARVSF